MRYEEWKLFESADLGIPEDFVVSEFEGECSINGFIAIPVSYISPRYLANDVYEISIPRQPAPKIYLLTCMGQPFQFQIASELFACAFLKDVSTTDLDGPQQTEYRFSCSYVVIESVAADEYRNNYSGSSAIWGGFSEIDADYLSYAMPTDKPIVAFADLELPTTSHHEVVLRANKDFSVLGRYLALYQMIELSFDYDMVQDIKGLGQDLKNIGKVLAQYGHSETVRLLRLITKYWTEEESLVKALGAFFSTSIYDAQIEELLFGYEKDGFPWNVKQDAVRRAAFLAHARLSFERANMEKAKIKYTLEELQKAVGFIVYRFRCAIAHASIGEYILTLEDEQFVCEKAEPLLLSFISEMYKK